MLNLEVYTVPLGASMREAFCQELLQLPAGAGVMVLPTGLLQDEVKQSYNLPCSGFDTMATKILNLNGYRHLQEINRHCQELYIETLLKYYTEQGQFNYFAALKDKQGFVKHLTSLLGQMARSGATVDEVTKALAAWGRSGNAGRKDQEVALIYQGYRNMLQLVDMFDLEGKYRLALKILQEKAQPALPWQYVYVSDFASLDALQIDFLLALAKRCQVKVGICYNKKQSVFEASRKTIERLEREVTLTAAAGKTPQRSEAIQHVVDNLGVELPKKLAVKGQQLELREYRDQKAELEGVLSEIKQAVVKGASLSDYVLAVRNLSSYAGLRQCADRYGIPVSLAEAELVAAQPLSELVNQLLLAGQDNRTGVMAYFSLLDNAITKLVNKENDLESLSWLRTEQFYTKRSALQGAIRALQGNNKVLDLLDDFLAKQKNAATIADYTEAIEDFLYNLELAPNLGCLYKEGHISLPGMRTILATEKKLRQLLKQLREDYADCDLAKEVYSLADFRRIWQEQLTGQTIILGREHKNGLLITDVLQLQGASFKKVYLLGLREGEFPAGNRENWLYNDKERGELQTLGIDLPNTFAAYAEDNYLFAGAVAAATEKLVLSYYKDDEAEGSPYLDDVQALFDDLKPVEAAPKGLACKEEALERSNDCDKAWLLQQLGTAAMTASAVDKERTGLYMGELQDKKLLEQLTRAGHYSFSASGLESYMECPFKYLGQNLWKQGCFSDKEELPDAALKGSIIHGTLARFVARYLDNKPMDYDYTAMQPILEADFSAVVQEFMDKGELQDNEFWPSEAGRLWRSLCWWLRFELKEQKQWATFKPVALEKSFGYRDAALKLTTANGLPAYLKGRVDRIDASDEHLFVSDYKSGGTPGDDNLQMPFYLLAAETLYPDKKIMGGNFVSLKHRQRSGGMVWTATGNANIKRKNYEFADWDEAKEVCQQLLLAPIEHIYKGDFAVAPSKGACDYCDLKDICRQRVFVKEPGGNAE